MVAYRITCRIGILDVDIFVVARKDSLVGDFSMQKAEKIVVTKQEDIEKSTQIIESG